MCRMVGVMGGSRVPMELCDNPGGKREKKKDKVECFDFITAHFRSNEDRRDLELGRHKMKQNVNGNAQKVFKVHLGLE